MKNTKWIGALLAGLLVLTVAGCQNTSDEGNPAASSTLPPSTEVRVSPHPGHSAGERFSMTMILEGMEQAETAEHYENGVYCMDYFCQGMTLEDAGNVQTFRWCYLPEIMYMRISLLTDTTALDYARQNMPEEQSAAVIAGKAAISQRQFEGDRYLQTYVFDTDAGCILVEQSYTAEAAEGVGCRMDAMLNTMALF